MAARGNDLRPRKGCAGDLNWSRLSTDGARGANGSSTLPAVFLTDATVRRVHSDVRLGMAPNRAAPGKDVLNVR